MLKKQNFILIAILVLACLLRLVNLGSIPTGFNDDEAAFGYNAYSILKTGRDEWGRLLPFPVFESFGDWKLVGYLYPTILSVGVFGLSEFAARFPSALFGVLAVFATYLLTRELFDQKTALIASFFLAISPWHIVASRNAFESDVLVFFITAAVFFFLRGLKNSRFIPSEKTLAFTPGMKVNPRSEDQNTSGFSQEKFIYFSAFLFSISFYFYRSSWLFVPLFVASLMILHKKQFKKTHFNVQNLFILALIFIIPLIPTVLTFKGQSRFVQESFISGITRTGIINQVNEKRGLCLSEAPGLLCTLLYNRFNEFTRIYVNNYLGNLSLKTYFETASPTGFQSFMTRSLLYTFDLPLIILGFIFLFKNNHPAAKVLVPWILLVPIGAAFAGVANYGRINIIMPTLQIVSASGLVVLISFFKTKGFKFLALAPVVTVILLSVLQLTIDLRLIEPSFTSRYQRYGYKELFEFLPSQSQYENIVLSRSLDQSHQYMQYLFFSKTEPNFFLDSVKRDRVSDGWVSVKKIGNVYFYDSTPSLKNIPKKSLLVVGEGEVKSFTQPLKTINFLNGDRAFEVYDADKLKSDLKMNEN